MTEKVTFTTGLTFGRHWQIEGWRGDRRLRVEFDPQAAEVVDQFPRRVLAKIVQNAFAEERAAAVYRSWSEDFSHWLVAVIESDLREAAAQLQPAE